jgi:hypothetical protein
VRRNGQPVAIDQTQTTTPYRRVAVLSACVILLVIAMTWTFLGMRAVMDVGGACADGGPYVSAQPCPDGVWMLALAIPMMIIVAMGGTAVAMSLSAPDLLSLMWVGLFGSLGWNFLEYGVFSGDLVWGWLICGVVFELMAAPVLFMLLPVGRTGSTWTPPTNREPVPTFGAWWWPTYAALAGIGWVLGLASFRAWS